MIDETVRDIVEAELREGEVLLWAEEIDSHPLFRRKWILNILPLLGMNAAFVTLYLSQFGNFSLKTTAILLFAGNFAGIARLIYEDFSDFKARKAEVGHAITILRLLTLAWNGRGAPVHPPTLFIPLESPKLSTILYHPF